MILRFDQFLVENQHDSFAEEILKEIKLSENKVDVFGDYKRGIRLKDGYVSVIKNLGRGRFSSSLLMSNKDTYRLVVNNTHYDVSNRTLKDIWKCLSKKADVEKYKQ